MDYILACNRGMTPPENLLLEDLRQSLDMADQSLLERRREQNGMLSFQSSMKNSRASMTGTRLPNNASLGSPANSPRVS